jgi:hypothetical protein
VRLVQWQATCNLGTMCWGTMQGMLQDCCCQPRNTKDQRCLSNACARTFVSCSLCHHVTRDVPMSRPTLSVRAGVLMGAAGTLARHSSQVAAYRAALQPTLARMQRNSLQASAKQLLWPRPGVSGPRLRPSASCAPAASSAGTYGVSNLR